ncbi:hypothetical protein Gohar_016192 [Gossypium harknessii]|uniref:Uncharacterized protein n=1 Tax=Gossypium harknessii TaxID=34285 RepID=A0A7J9G273_9ROSI|nr:hypothetical protein [Gossypium harknessii]
MNIPRNITGFFSQALSFLLLLVSLLLQTQFHLPLMAVMVVKPFVLKLKLLHSPITKLRRH